MLEVDKEFTESLDNGQVQPLNNIVIARRDERPDELILKESGLAIALPEDQLVRPDWVTVLAAPKTINDRFGKRECTLKAGDRCFARPSAGYKMWDMDQNLQTIHVTDILAVEVDGKVVPFDHVVFVQKAARPQTFKNSLIIVPDSAWTNTDLEFQDRGIVTQLGVSVQEPLEIDNLVIFEHTQAITIDKENRIFALPEDCIFSQIESSDV